MMVSNLMKNKSGYISPLPKRKAHSEVSLSGLVVEIVVL